MSRIVIRLGVVVGIAVAIVALMAATKNEPDEVVAGTSTSVSFRVSTRDYQRGEPAAAAALWIVCSATVDGDVTAAVRAGDGWQATVTPAIGEHGTKRLVGCLEDTTLERVVGHVVEVKIAG